MGNDRWHRLGLAAIFVIALAQAAVLRCEGRRWWCACGGWSLWSGDAWGSHNSQHLFDPYSFTHVEHGFLLCWLAALLLPRMMPAWRFTLAAATESAWEALENSSWVIDRYRQTAAIGYTGDSVANSLGDLASCLLGYWLARRLGWRRSVLVVVTLELVLLVWIRDNLALNILMLAWPIDAIRRWQAG